MCWRAKFPKLSPKNWPFNVELLPPTTCLVGGAVRDALLNRQKEYLDLDFVLPEGSIKTAKIVADRYKAGFVVLDKERQIARVVFEGGTLDFARQEGDNLETDLRRRDFTVNAIAYNPHCDELIDPLGGLTDLEQRRLKMVSPINLEDDPLRLLRAYRQAAQLNFTIEETTRATIRTLAPLLGKVAAERVQTELGYLLVIPQGSIWLSAAIEDGLLQPWLKNAQKYSLEQLTKVDSSAKLMANTWSKSLSNSLSWYSLAKLATLVSSVPEEAESELLGLKYSRSEIKTVTTTLKYLPQLQKLTDFMSLKEQYFLFLNVGNIFPILAVLSIARGVDFDLITPLINRYFNPKDIVAHPQSLVRGNQLMEHLQIPPSDKIGKLLTEIQLARIEGKISTYEDALKLAAQLNLEMDK